MLLRFCGRLVATAAMTLSLLVGMFPRNSYRGLAASIPPIMRPRNIGCGWTLGVTILAIVKTVVGVGRHTERGAKAIALYIGAAAKWARIKFDVTHVLDSAVITNARASKIRERCVTITGCFSGNACATKFSACCFKTQECFASALLWAATDFNASTALCVLDAMSWARMP